MIAPPPTPPSTTGGPVNPRYVWSISLTAALGGLLFGYDWVVIGGAMPFYERYFSLNEPSAQGWAMNCALVGSLLGALVSGWSSDRWGRKKRLLAAAILFGVSSLATGLAQTSRDIEPNLPAPPDANHGQQEHDRFRMLSEIQTASNFRVEDIEGDHRRLVWAESYPRGAHASQVADYRVNLGMGKHQIFEVIDAFIARIEVGGGILHFVP